MFRLSAALLVTLALTAARAHAADGDADTSADASKITIPFSAIDVPEKRPAVLPVLYLTLAGLQGYDVYSTRQGIANGAREVNPLVALAAGDTTSMIVMKAVSTATTIVMAERLWHRNKAAAIVTMVVANGVMAIVAANNARVLRQTR